MPTNQYGQTEWDADPETAAELRRLANQEKMAAEMMKRGQVPLTGGMVGQTYVGASPLQGIANMLHQYNASKAAQNAEEGYKALGGRKAQEYADAISAYKKNTIGTPGTPEQALFTDDYTAVPKEDQVKAAVPAMVPTPDQRRQAIIEAAVSTNTRLSKMGQMDLQHDYRKEDKKDAIQSRMDELSYRLAEGRITKEEADKRSADLRREMQEAGFAQQRSMAQLAAGLRQPAAPTMTEVVDPSDPKRMLRVDAKEYKGGTLGEAGVLGVSGKEPTHAAKEDKVKNGREQLTQTLDQVLEAYDELHRLEGLPSQERGLISNIGSSIASSGIGQMAGRVGSTKEQVERDVIKAARLNVLNALKQATGKTAQELNSNVELKTNLEALSDPSQGYEAATRIIDNIKKTYLEGGANSSGRSAAGKIGSNPHAGKTDAQIKAELGIGG